MIASEDYWGEKLLKEEDLMRMNLIASRLLTTTGLIVLFATGANAGTVPGAGSVTDAYRDNQTTRTTKRGESSHGKTERLHEDRGPASAGQGKPVNEMVSPEESNDQAQARNPRDASLPRDAKGVVGSRAAQLRRDEPGMVGAPINLDHYPFEKKDEFKSVMSTRLNEISSGLETLKQVPSSAQQSKSQETARIQKVEQEKARVDAELQKIDSVQASNWQSFKTQFRDDVRRLENDYRSVATARR